MGSTANKIVSYRCVTFCDVSAGPLALTRSIPALDLTSPFVHSARRYLSPPHSSVTHGKIANVSRIMKSSVPATAKISKEAKECVQECVSEFISFITSEAAEKCQMEKRKTIGGEDILYAMVTLGFENYAETLKIHLAKLRQVRAFLRRRIPLAPMSRSAL